LVGELAALGAALLWAVGSLLLKPLSARFHPFFINQIRLYAAVSLFAFYLLATGGFAELAKVNYGTVTFAIMGTWLGVGVGDSLFILSLRYLDLSKAYPLSNCGYPLVTVAISLLFLNEEVKGLALFGFLLVLAGLYFVAFPSGPWRARFSFRASKEKTGLVLVLLTILAWGISILGIKKGTVGLEIPVANFIRYTGTAILLLPFSLAPGARLSAQKIDGRALVLTCLSGILGFAIAGIFFIIALRESGAAVTSVLSSTSPLFLLPMSVFFLKEKVTLKLLIGVILSVLGICFVFLPALIF